MAIGFDHTITDVGVGTFSSPCKRLVQKPRKLCECGCGDEIELTRKSNARYRRDCFLRLRNDYKNKRKKQATLMQRLISNNRLCKCGCGFPIEPERSRAGILYRKGCRRYCTDVRGRCKIKEPIVKDFPETAVVESI
jgi:hypothetical protein